MRSPLRILALVVVSLPCLVALQCSEDTVALEDAFPAAIVLVNSTPDSLHVYAAHETISPANKLAPDGNRTVTISVRTGGTYGFHTGRNGAQLAFRSCTVKVGATRTDTYRVVAAAAGFGCEGTGWGAGQI